MAIDIEKLRERKRRSRLSERGRKSVRIRCRRYRKTDKGKAAQLRWRNSTKGREYSKNYRKREHVIYYRREYAKKYKETGRAKESHLRWRRSEKGKANKLAAYNLRRSKQRVSIPDSDRRAIENIYLKCRAYKRAGFSVEVDHIVALANGGLHIASNLQIIYAVENREKRNRTDFIPSTIFV